MLAITGGNGLVRLPEPTITDRCIVHTSYSLISSPILSGRLGGLDVASLAWHGFDHTITPHEINYRISTWALYSIGVGNIIIVLTVTSINRELENGSLVIPHDLIDYTYGRKNTFSEGQGQAVVHTNFARPYSTELCAMLLEHVGSCGTYVYSETIYDYAQGLRFTTHAEVHRCRNNDMGVLSMAGMSEAVLAREFDIGYAYFCDITGMSRTTNSGNGRPGFCQTGSYRVIEKIRRLLIDLWNQLCPTP